MKKLLVLLFLGSLSIYGQILDPTFNAGHDGPYDEFIAYGGMLTDDGKLLTSNGSYLSRYNSDGSPDNTFTTVNLQPQQFFNGLFKGSNGKFGGFSSYNSSGNLNWINFFNQDGSTITGFTQPILTCDSNCIPTLDIVRWQDDGKVIIVGDFTSVNGLPYNRIARLNANGSVDATFNVGTGATNGKIFCMVRQPDGKYVIGGSFMTFNGVTKKHVARLNSDGSIDDTFINFSSAYPYNDVTGITIQADGKIMLGGSSFSSNGVNFSTRSLIRLLANGTRDTSFTCSVGIPNAFGNFLVLPSGKYLLVNEDYNILYRLNTNGSIDYTFTYNNTTDIGYMQNKADNKIFINGSYKSPTGITRKYMHVINEDGTIDLTFNPQESTNDACQTIKVLKNNKIIVTGNNITAYNDVGCGPYCIRLTEAGELDPTFTLDNQIVLQEELTIKGQNDNKLIIGKFDADNANIYLNSTNKELIRINENGSLDTSFNLSSSIYSVRDFEILNDGKILIVGAYIVSPGNAPIRQMRLNSDGSLDTSFTAIATHESSNLIKFEDGSLFRIGSLYYDNYYTNYERLIKLNPDGTLDTSFNCTINKVKGVQRQSDGKYLMSYNNSYGRNVVRVTNTGALDPTFTTINNSDMINNVTPDSVYDPLFINSENKIFIFRFTLDGYAANTIDIYNANGVLEQTVSGFSKKLMVKQGCDNIISAFNSNNLRRCKIFAGTITPPPTGASPQGFVADYTLANLIVSGVDVTWYNSQSQCGLNMVQRINQEMQTADIPLPLSTPLVDGTTYYASQNIGGIESSYRLPILVSSTLGINEINYESFSINNPVRNYLQIHSNSNFNKIELYSINGVKVFEKTFQNNTDAEINIGKISKGFYIVKLYTEKDVFSKKIIKE